MSAGLGRIQRKILAATSQDIVVLHLMKGSRSSLSRAVRSLERRGLVQVWRVRVPVPSGSPHHAALRRITVVTSPGYNQKHVVGWAVEMMRRSGHPGRPEVRITVVTPPGYNQKHVGRMRRSGHPDRCEVRITVVTPPGYNQKHVGRMRRSGHPGRHEVHQKRTTAASRQRTKHGYLRTPK